jgi:hypothetical protein
MDIFEATQVRYTDGSKVSLNDFYLFVEEHETPAQVAQSLANYLWRNNKRVIDVDGNWITKSTIIQEVMRKKGFIDEFTIPFRGFTDGGIDFLWHNQELWEDTDHEFHRIIVPEHTCMSYDDYQWERLFGHLAMDDTWQIYRGVAENRAPIFN